MVKRHSQNDFWRQVGVQYRSIYSKINIGTHKNGHNATRNTILFSASGLYKKALPLKIAPKDKSLTLIQQSKKD